jgi:broad specificity phosphatase PhoE
MHPVTLCVQITAWSTGVRGGMLYLVRHGEAGDKHLWYGDDAVRPITPLGRLQSEALVAALSQYPVRRIISSPTARCVQTVEPLARRRNLPIETDLDLAVDSGLDAVRALAERVWDDAAVLCTHGEVIGAFLGHVFANGVARPPGRTRWQKGSVWVLGGLDDGSPTARYLPPSPS